MTPTTPQAEWPDAVDMTVTWLFLAIVVILPTIGYVFMVLDFRAYLRSLKRGVVQASHYIWHTPEWARHETPYALVALGLRLPCTEEDLKRAYRKRVKKLHPDHGGDQRRFLMLQAQFEQALAILAHHRAADSVTEHAA